MPRPDFSEYVVHFTKNAAPWSSGRPDTPVAIPAIAQMNALARLLSILNERWLRATPMPFTGKQSACFTECVWASLLDHAQMYSRYGIGFKKSFLFEHGGGPALYMRQDLYQSQVQQGGWHDAIWPFITPFVPEYASDDHVTKYWGHAYRLDYTHEREWRVPHDLQFQLSDVEFVIVASGNDGALIPPETADALQGKVLLMDNYSRINEFWPWQG